MRYDSFSVLYPPRPTKAVARSLIDHWSRRGWVAQVKKNGTCSVIAVAPDRTTLVCRTRHGDQHKAWRPSLGTAAAFRDLPGTGWWVFAGELLHSKVPGLRDVHYLFDVLVADGRQLVGEDFRTRQQLMAALFAEKVVGETQSHVVIDDHTWVALNHEGDLGSLFDTLSKPEDEGIVIKNPNAFLEPCFRPSANEGWQIKCRRPHANYSF